MLKAKHIMTKNVICVKKDTPIYRCLEQMAEHKLSGIPVVEDDMSIVGIISEKDVLHLFHLDKDQEEKTVNDFMTQPAIHFDESESLLVVCKFLAKNIFRIVPITSKGKLVGIIDRVDIISHIVKAKKNTETKDSIGQKTEETGPRCGGRGKSEITSAL
jgi:CBS domain-containing protein